MSPQFETLFGWGHARIIVSVEMVVDSFFPGRLHIVSLVNCYVECSTNPAWGPPGARDMTTVVKHI